MSGNDAHIRLLSIGIAAVLPMFPVFVASIFVIGFHDNVISGIIFSPLLFKLFVPWLLVLSVLVHFRVMCGFSNLSPGKIWKLVALLHLIFVIPSVVVAPIAMTTVMKGGIAFFVFVLVVLLAFIVCFEPVTSNKIDSMKIMNNNNKKISVYILVILPSVISNILTLFMVLLFAISLD